MAYVLWRVFMKRYSKVRLGLRNLPVIPAERRGPEKEETWTLAPDQSGDACSFFDDVSDAKPKPIQDVDNPQSRILDPGETQQTNQQFPQEHPETGTLPRSQETRKSKTKKVKSYLRKCKGALSKGDEASTEKKRQEHCTSWYLDESHQEDPDNTFHLQKQSEFLDERIAEEPSAFSPDPVANLSKEVEGGGEDETLARLGEDEGRASELRRSRTSLYEDARDSMNDRECIGEESCKRNDAISLETLTTEEVTNLNKCDSNDTLIAEVAANGPPLVEEGKEEEGEEVDGETLRALSLFGGRGDVASLVRNLLGPIYGDGVINLLIRQARDILVCAYHGNLENFLKTYLSPAATLLAEVKSAAASEMVGDLINRLCARWPGPT
ncbi:uncharacterized protein LOC102680287 [Apis dorsata]|uniref:uncharacterized protein LOC102680287 n=1 Tax=Apis dorsata TaxID=7462 RepID=UPI001292D3A9|nr:uncharacterized protein LOC102680287 [Apis dorsata]